MARIVAAVLAVYSFYLIRTSLTNLPSRIPIHFNASGQPNGWGSPHTLWFLLFFQVLVGGLMLSMSTWGRRHPRLVHVGNRRLSDFTPVQRERIWPLLDQMGAWMGVATSLFFVFIIRESIRAAESSDPQFHAGWVAVLFVIGMVGLAFYYLLQINKAARGVRS